MKATDVNVIIKRWSGNHILYTMTLVVDTVNSVPSHYPAAAQPCGSTVRYSRALWFQSAFNQVCIHDLPEGRAIHVTRILYCE